ncbi:class I SAM-dependent methyltransferase [Sulfurisoma sediminicola]|uniref:SAM-dependent MidA family methyltransferase n=1 Tax=Sulfurisoma sediminicola TaxID=1381557 RepID=A0A497XLC8_9PROT|nr:SAM-dependent methyltransferase [Sulfurisoma sediminicola]RLJ68115.1 SAM-dependent MidA family methyltransferase [Sulfurisoma sediminicola]
MNPPLPSPSADAQASSHALCDHIVARIGNAGGWIPFVEFMDMALHLPGLGYYAGGSHKFGEQGDFVTAPELSPLFGQALAAQIAEITAVVAPTVLEVGAGSGRLAADLLPALEALGSLPDKYLILEVSGELRARQRETIRQAVPALADRVEWLEALPERFSGCIVANELLDAIPTHAVAWRDEGAMERGVTFDGGRFAWAERPAEGALREAMERLATEVAIEAPYVGEIGLAAAAWVAEWGQRLERGALLLLDYGLPRRELYHPGRNGGTLRCHYRHRSHDDPFWWPGLSDITSHIDFTAVAEAGYGAGLDVLGYTSQASFLINCGIGELLAARQQAGDPAMVKAAGAVSVLLSPGEMGELFKVIALGKGMTEPLRGFARGDRTHAL